MRRLLFLYFWLGIFGNARATACEPQPLPLVYPALRNAPASPVNVQFALEKDGLHVQFTAAEATIYGKESLAPGEYPFQFDVVEVFVSVNGGLPYYEFELTPFSQSFEVKIRDPRRPFESNLHLGAQYSAERSEQGFTAEIKIPLSELGWRGDARLIVGNAFAILGKGKARTYYSLSLPPQRKPRFHQPRYFRPLLCVD